MPPSPVDPLLDDRGLVALDPDALGGDDLLGADDGLGEAGVGGEQAGLARAPVAPKNGHSH